MYKGGSCCKYEKDSKNNCDGPDVDKKNDITFVDNVVIEGDSYPLYYSNHIFKHMQDIGLDCYDTYSLTT